MERKITEHFDLLFVLVPDPISRLLFRQGLTKFDWNLW